MPGIVLAPNMQGAGEVALEFPDGLDCFVPELDYLSRVPVKDLPCGSGQRLAPEPVNEFFSKRFLERTYMLAYSGLRKADSFSRPGETLQVYYLTENHKPVDIHSASFRLLAPRRPNPAVPFPSESFPLSLPAPELFLPIGGSAPGSCLEPPGTEIESPRPVFPAGKSRCRPAAL